MINIGQANLNNEDGWERDPKPESNIKYVTLEVGDSVEGTYDDKKKSKFDNNVYLIKDNEGKITGVNSAGDLDDWMRNRKPGSLIRIRCVDEKDTGKPNPMKLFEVDHRK